MTKFSVRKPMTVLVAIVIIFTLGFASLRGMTPELLPNIELPYVITVTTYPGASPEKVEDEVTRSLEGTFATLEGLESIQSQSSENVSLVIMEFSDSADLNAVSLDIVQKVNQIEGAWDDMVGTPIILKMNPDMLPIMIAAVEREGSDTADLSRFMEDTLQSRLEGVDGVASLDVSGLRVEQVNVVLRKEKIAEVNARVAEAIKGEFTEKEQELHDSQAELEDTLDELKTQSNTLNQGAEQLAEKIGEGSGELTRAWADLVTGLQDQKAMLAELQASLQLLIAEEEAARAAMGGSLPPAIEEQFETAKAQLQGGISQLEAGIAAVQGMEGTLADAQRTLDQTTISTLFGLSSGSAQLAVAQSQITGALTQIEQGLTQIEEARDAAVEKADMSSALTMETISGILMAQNFSMPAGYVQEGFDEYLVQVGDEITSLEEMQELVLLDAGIDDVEPIRLIEVADVFMSDNLDELYAKINGHDGILLSFNKQSERATTEVTDSILERFNQLSEQYPGLRFTPLFNQGDYIYMVMGSITGDLLWGALFAVIILLLFLRDLRPTFITLTAIPISLVFALVAMYFSGVTINIISLSGLAIAVGRLVDDSVVVIENIFRLRSKGYSPIKAAVNGAGQVAGAIIASTLTTICVFLPIVFVQGLTRQLFTDFALTFAYALLASLLVALTLVPTMASGMFKKMEPKEHRVLDRVIALYDRALVWTLRFKPVVLVGAALLLAASVAVVMSRGFAYMPEGNSGQLNVNLTMPKELSLEERRMVADEASSRVARVEGVETVGTMTGSASLGGGGSMSLMMGGGGGQGAVLDSAVIYATLDQDRDMERITSEVESNLEGLNAQYEVSSSGMMDASALGGEGVTVNLFGDSIEDMIVASDTLTEELGGLDGVIEVDNGFEESTPVLHFTVDRGAAAKHGLTTAQVYQQVSSALTQERSATDVSWDSAGYDVVIVNEGAQDDLLTPAYIKELEFTVTKRDGSTERVKLGDIATFSEGQTLQTIQRSEQRRLLPVSVSVAEDYNITLATQNVERALQDISLPDGVTYEVTGENTTIMESFRELGLMLLLGLLLVYLIMVAQFQSLKSPFIIMFTVPLAFTGGLLALLITNKVLSVISLIGFAMLVGVIVSNAIVLVDYINRLRREGVERVAAIREGAATRMRPILMTALATIGALLMMALGLGNGSEMMQPLAIVCIGGLAYGTLMTLFVIPIIYDLLNKKELRTVSDEDLATVDD
jgi:HAE1 family hydrophobic/amphiphilic exporter-1